MPAPIGVPAAMVGVDQARRRTVGPDRARWDLRHTRPVAVVGLGRWTTWSLLDDYPPLGTWNGDGEGTGLSANGTLVSDGDRFIAYRGDGDVQAWTSTDGATWSPLQVVGKTPDLGGDPDYPWLVVLPVGLMIVGGDHDAGIGVPSV